jgi:hypothetical protein
MAFLVFTFFNNLPGIKLILLGIKSRGKFDEKPPGIPPAVT